MELLRHAAVLRAVPRPIRAVSETARKPNVSEEELFEMEAGVMEAVKERDMAYLDRMLGENFVLTTGWAGAEVRFSQE